MWGKAKDVKLKDFSSIENYEDWTRENPNYQVIEIISMSIGEFTVVYKESEGWL